MVIKVKLSIERGKLKRIIQEKRSLIYRNIENVFINEAIPHLIDLIMIGFDTLGERMRPLPEDPTNPENWRDDFYNRLHEDAYETISFNYSGDKAVFSVKIGDKEFLGYDQESDKGNTPLIWLVYYLEGLAGEWGFVSSEMAGRPVGRFGEGFMISREAYDAEGWQAKTGKTFEEIRHPFSEYSPLDIFREAVEEFRLTPFIKKAVDAAKQNKEL